MSSMYVGEALAGEGNEVAHIDLLIGSKDGPVGVAFANALADIVRLANKQIQPNAISLANVSGKFWLGADPVTLHVANGLPVQAHHMAVYRMIRCQAG